MYRPTKSAVWDGNSTSHTFHVTTGVRQGCILSPLIFALYTDDVELSIRGGVEIGKTIEHKINVIMYADDIVILAESSNMLKIMIGDLMRYLEANDLKLNIKKTKHLIYNKKKGRIAKVDKIYIKKTLGAITCQNLNHEEHVKSRAIEAKRQ